MYGKLFIVSKIRGHTRCALVTGVQTCALPISVAVPRLGHPAAVGRRLVVAVREGRFLRQLLRLVPRHVPALPLRPDHAAGLEGVHSAEHRVDRGDGADGVLRRVRGRQVMSKLTSWFRGLLRLGLFAGMWLAPEYLFKPK